MDELREKLELLLKGLLATKPKPIATMPSIKVGPLKSPPATSFTALPDLSRGMSVKPAAKPSEVAGGPAPASQKDPIKVVEQLRNPHPSGPKMEVLKVEDNGQWSLAKVAIADEDSRLNMSPQSMPAPPPIPPDMNFGRQLNQPEKTPVPVPREDRLAVLKAAAQRAPVRPAKHGFAGLTPEQSQLIDGLTLHDRVPLKFGANGAAWAKSVSHGDQALVKNALDHKWRWQLGHTRRMKDGSTFNAARREVLYHDLAQHLGMGKYVPLTSGFTRDNSDWSAQKRIYGASEPSWKTHGFECGTVEGRPYQNESPDVHVTTENPNHERVLKQLHDNGEIDKLTLMNHLLGSHDRHGHNVMIDDNGDGIHMVDNGLSFDYGNVGTHLVPWYRRAFRPHPLPQGTALANGATALPGLKTKHDSERGLHPAAKAWFDSIDPDQVVAAIKAHGHDDTSPAVQGFMDRYSHLRSALSKHRPGKGPSIDDLLQQGKEMTKLDPEEFR